MSKKGRGSSVCAFTWKNPDWKSCLLPSHTGMQKSHQLWLCSRPVLTHLHPTPPCSSVSWWGTQRALRCRTPGDDGGSEPSFPMKDSNCLLSQFASFMGLLWSDISSWPRCLRWQRSQDGLNGRCLQTSFYRTKSFLVPVLNRWSRCSRSPKQFDKHWKLCWTDSPRQ